jgi:hypothetical protein
VVNGTPYLGWCAEQESTALNSAPTGVLLYAIDDPANPIANPNWKKVNYILNNKGSAAVNDIQAAIWFFVNGAFPNPIFHPFTLASAQALVNAANASGATFVPGPGQVAGVLLYQDGYGSIFQDTLIEVQIPQIVGAVGDYVWLDTNRDGIQDATESGINNVRVKLYDSSNNFITSMLTQNNPNTGAAGWYLFPQLAFGSYKVTVDLTTVPSGLTPTLTNATSNTALDSSNPTTGAIGVINSANPVDLTLDFGFVSPNWCGLTWGFWKNHTEKWPVTTLTMGGKSYSYSELITILATAVKGDDSVNLAHQLIAAKLNYAMGVQLGVGTKITTADSLLAAYAGKVPLKVKSAAMVSAAAELDKYNSDGLLQPGCTMRY